MSDHLSLGKNAVSVDVSPEFDSYTRVTIVIDEEHEISVGTDVGRELVLECPWGTTAIANNILASLRGFQYQPYSSEGALLNPAAELGDAVTVNGTYGGIYAQTTTYSRLMQSDISAPHEEEIDYEYQYISPTERKITRQFNGVTTELSVQNGRITAEVTERTSQYNSLSASLSVVSGQISAEVTRATSAEGTLSSRITANANQITAKVSKTGGSSSTFGWTLNDSSWTLYSGSKTVLKATSSGIEITGKITATSGYIGNESSGFTIGSKAIYNGVTSMSDTAHTGIYLGTDGIVLGKGVFKVTSSGALTASSATLTGTINATSGTIGSGSNVFTISSNSIRNGLTSLYDTSHTGIYLGTDGIALGQGKFRVDSSGNLTANSGTFSGSTYASSIKSDGVNGYGGSFSGSGLADESVGYGKTGFKGTLNQVGTNKSDIAGIKAMFTNSLYCNLVSANRAIISRLDASDFYFESSGVSWKSFNTGSQTLRYLGR